MSTSHGYYNADKIIRFSRSTKKETRLGLLFVFVSATHNLKRQEKKRKSCLIETFSCIDHLFMQPILSQVLRIKLKNSSPHADFRMDFRKSVVNV